MSVLDNLPHKCKIKTRKYRSDGLMGRAVDDSVSTSDVPCWEQPVSANEFTRYQRKGVDITQKIYFRDDPDVNLRSRIIITERNGVAVPESDQVELRVVGSPVPDASIGLGIVYRVFCVAELPEESA